jgi:hypothetical protein
MLLIEYSNAGVADMLVFDTLIRGRGTPNFAEKHPALID